MQKGYKREGKGMAILRCFIGLFIVIVVVLLAIFMLRLDYSDKLGDDVEMRPYVEVTPSPTPDPNATVAPGLVPVDAATEKPTATPTAKPTPTPTPVPTPTPEPTPEPTLIPAAAYSPIRMDLSCPPLSTNAAQMAITGSYISAANDNKVLELRGYGYIDNPAYDAANSQLYLVIRQESTGLLAFAQVSMQPGASGVEHADAQCGNPASSDFVAVLDVSGFSQDIYSLGLVIGYQIDGKANFEFFRFPEGVSFTVLGGQIISDVPVEVAE